MIRRYARLVSRTPLRATKPMKRTARLRPVNPERKARLYVRNYLSDDYREWLVGHGCAVPGCNRRPVVAAHARSKGGSGDWRDLFPLCATNPATGEEGHHEEQHRLGIRTWESKHGVDAEIIARCFAGVWMERGGAEPASASDDAREA